MKNNDIGVLASSQEYFHGFSTVESSINSYKPQKCGIFLSNFIFLYVACVACLWYNGLEVIMIEALF